MIELGYQSVTIEIDFRLKFPQSEGRYLVSFVSKCMVYMGFLAVIALVGLWYVGGNKSEFEGRIEIRATPEHVFEKLIDPAARELWQTGVSNVELLSEPPVALESRYRATYQLNRVSTQIRERVLQFQNAQWLSIQAEMNPGLRTSIFRLTRAGDQTILQYKISEQPLGMQRLFAPFQTSQSLQQIEKELVSLKQLVEVGPAQPAAAN